jgi:hypothetical protein
VVIEGRDFEHLGRRQAIFVRERHQHRRRQMSFGVLDAVQRLDQQVAPPGQLAEQGADRLQRNRIDRPSLRSNPQADRTRCACFAGTRGDRGRRG